MINTENLSEHRSKTKEVDKKREQASWAEEGHTQDQLLTFPKRLSFLKSKMAAMVQYGQATKPLCQSS